MDPMEKPAEKMTENDWIVLLERILSKGSGRFCAEDACYKEFLKNHVYANRIYKEENK